MVSRMQRELDGLGYDAGPADGVWGDRMRQALQAFQRDRGLPADGRLNAPTLAAIQAGGAVQTGQLPPPR
jgi:peptidoglycan hydrolase-like protein with peptidoglycan-binding domain